MIVKKRLAIMLSVFVMTGIALDCTAAPKSQCQDGSVKVTVNRGHKATYHCSNGEWVKQGFVIPTTYGPPPK